MIAVNLAHNGYGYGDGNGYGYGDGYGDGHGDGRSTTRPLTTICVLHEECLQYPVMGMRCAMEST